MPDPSVRDVSRLPVTGITRVRTAEPSLYQQEDLLTVEEPLEIRVGSRGQKTITLAITMRTPGNDRELAAGFLFAEGLVKTRHDLLDLAPDPEAVKPDNSMTATLASEAGYDSDRLQRHFFTNSSCGVCGKTSMQALELLHHPQLSPQQPQVTAASLCQLPQLLRQQQQQFSATGGVHSAALFSAQGQLLRLREDVGRHNAVDKLIGSLLLDDQLPSARHAVLLVSGRASFELVQKALMADIAFLAAIGAPSSLALQLADRHGMTLAGFLKADGFNVYTGSQRIHG